MARAFLLLLVVSSAACSDPVPIDACPRGICRVVDSGTDARSSVLDGSVALDATTSVDVELSALDANVPDDTGSSALDVLVALDSLAPTTDTSVLPVPDTAVAPPDTNAPARDGCVESWTCSPWQTNGVDNMGTRVCTDGNSCGSTTTRPSLSASLPALDLDFFECNVEPILDRGCSQLACHGKESGRALRHYARGRHRITGETYTEMNQCLSPGRVVRTEDCIGSIECACQFFPKKASERRRSYDSARGFALGSNGLRLTDSTQSELVTQPQIGAGFSHQNVHFWRTTDADYQTIVNWLNGMTLGRSCASGN